MYISIAALLAVTGVYTVLGGCISVVVSVFYNYNLDSVFPLNYNEGPLSQHKSQECPTSAYMGT